MAIGGLKIYLHPANKLIQLSMNLSPSSWVPYINSLWSKIEESPSSSTSPGPLLSLRYCQLGNCFSERNPQIKCPLIWELVGAINPSCLIPSQPETQWGDHSDHSDRSQSPRTTGSGKKQTHKTESKRKHLQFTLKVIISFQSKSRSRETLNPESSTKHPC